MFLQFFIGPEKSHTSQKLAFSEKTTGNEIIIQTTKSLVKKMYYLCTVFETKKHGLLHRFD